MTEARAQQEKRETEAAAREAAQKAEAARAQREAEAIKRAGQQRMEQAKSGKGLLGRIFQGAPGDKRPDADTKEQH